MSSARDLMINISGSARKLRGATGEAKKELSGVADTAEKAGKASGTRFGQGLSSGVLGMAKKLAGPVAAVLALDKIKDFAKDAYGEARESQKVGALTTQVIKSTGGAAKVTAQQVGDLATAISNKTGIDDETIQSGANMLLTFKNIRNEVGKGNDIFNQSTSILTDMSAAMGTEPKQAAIQLGKALNDPVKGISALSRVGVTFTEQQKKTIGALVKGGKTAEAQKIILSELKSEFGGAAAAQSTMGEKAATAWANMKEAIGTAFLPVVDQLFGALDKGIPKVSAFVEATGPKMAKFFGRLSRGISTGVNAVKLFIGAFTGKGSDALVPDKWMNPIIDAGAKARGMFDQLAGAVKGVFGFVKTTAIPAAGSFIGFLIKWRGVLTPIAVGVLAIAGAMKVYRTTLAVASGVSKAFAAVQAVVNAVMSANPIGLIVLALVGLVAGLIYAYKHSEKFRKVVDAAFGGVKKAVSAVVDWFKNSFIPFFTRKIPGAFGKLVSFIKGVFLKVWKVATFVSPVALAVTLIVKHWKAITAAFASAKKWVSGTWKRGWSGVKGWVGDAVGKGRDKVKDAWTSTRGKFSAAKDWVSGTWKRGWSNVKTWMSDSVKTGRDKVGDAWTSARGKFSNAKTWVSSTWKRNWSGVKTWMSDAVKGGKDKIGDAWTSARGKFSAAKDWVKGSWKRTWSGVKAIMKDPVGAGKTAISNILGKTGLRSVFSNAVTAIGKIWDKIKDKIAAPIKWVVDHVINGVLISGINKIGNFVGLGGSDHRVIDPLNTRGLARGGILPGFTPYASGDDQVRPMRSGEGVAVSEAMKDPYERARLLAVNKAALRGEKLTRFQGEGFAGGGLVNWKGGTFTPQFAAELQAAQKMTGSNIFVYQGGFRPATSYSGTSHAGDAVDLGPVTAAMVAALRRLGIAAWRRGPAQGFSLRHIHGVPLPGHGRAGGSGVWQAQNYLQGGDGLGGRDYEARPGVLGSSFLSKLIGRFKGAVSALFDPEKLLTGAVRKILGTAGDVARSPFGNIVSKVPVKLAGMSLDWAKRKALSFDQGGMLPTGTSLVNNGTGQPEPLRRVDREQQPQINIYVDGALDPVAVGRQVARYVEQYSRSGHGVRQTIRSRA